MFDDKKKKKKKKHGFILIIVIEMLDKYVMISGTKYFNINKKNIVNQTLLLFEIIFSRKKFIGILFPNQ